MVRSLLACLLCFASSGAFACGLELSSVYPLILAYGDTPVSLPEFQAQIKGLREQGYRFTTLQSFQKALQKNIPSTGSEVILTFDQGFADHMELARWLKSEKIPAHFFVAPGWIETPVQGRKYMSWKDLKEISKASSFSVESYTQERPLLKTMSGKDIERELQVSQKNLRKKFSGKSATFLAYPEGGYDQVAALAAGKFYAMAFTRSVDPMGTPDLDSAINPCFQVPRLEITSDLLRPERFLKKISQYSYQLLKYPQIAHHWFKTIPVRSPASDSSGTAPLRIRTFNRRDF